MFDLVCGHRRFRRVLRSVSGTTLADVSDDIAGIPTTALLPTKTSIFPFTFDLT